MSAEKLLQTLSALHPLSESFRQAIEKEATLLSLPRSHILLEAPRVAGHAFFLCSGFAMSYVYDEGDKHVGDFWGAGEFIIPVKSFCEQAPSKEFIQLMVKSDVLCISYEAVQRMLTVYPETHAFHRKILLRSYEQCRERAYDMQHLSATLRYDKLLRIYRGIEQLVAQEYIASWLGITPQSLSRIKRERNPS